MCNENFIIFSMLGEAERCASLTLNDEVKLVDKLPPVATNDIVHTMGYVSEEECQFFRHT